MTNQIVSEHELVVIAHCIEFSTGVTRFTIFRVLVTLKCNIPEHFVTKGYFSLIYGLVKCFHFKHSKLDDLRTIFGIS